MAEQRENDQKTAASRKTAKLKNRLLAPVEWLGIAAGLCIMPWLPRRALFPLCDLISRVMYIFDRRGRRRALENLRILRGEYRNFPDVVFFNPDAAPYDPSPGEERIVRRSYRNMSRTVGYAFWTCFRARARCAATGVMCEEGRKFLSGNRPVVTVSGHIGCWELLSQLAFLEGHGMMSVAKDIGTPGMTALLMKARRSIGQEIVRAEGAFRPLMQGLRRGLSLGLLVDQSVSPKRGGVWVKFLGMPMSVSAAPAFFAAKGMAPIAVAWSRPLKDGRYRCEVVDVISAAEARDVWATTQRCAADLERVVRRHPSCWVLNYNFFSNLPRPEDLVKLKAKLAGAK
ncbi:MAG: lysophospholipid acyltransferase family protein [Kiritimatiellae bacterium]|nr:lysophospholipid acyltransferase family protein [Kiritimatiellia bacterium]